MNDLERLLGEIDQIAAPLKQVTDSIKKVISPYIELRNEITRVCEPFITQINTASQAVADAARKWQVARKEDVVVMAENGWYPNELTFFYVPKNKPNSLNQLMLMHLNDNWEEITSTILEFCPNRAHILKNAFSLHKSGNYIAAIPLFLSQADGICCESLKSFLFTGNDAEEKINNLIDRGEIEANMFTDIFLEPFKLKNHHNSGISKSSQSAKAKAPSRNGILHGHRKHLDYGTEINSLKCFSLLSFVVYSKEILHGKNINK